jgi:Trypsin-like peptidase domain/Tetratricopeptide repeat
MQKQVIASLLGISLTTSIGSIAPLRVLALSPTENTTDKIVFIKTQSGQGSGVIIKHVGDTYTILTAAHVVNDLKNAPLEIITPDRQEYTANASEVKIAPDALDLATITFQSQQKYPVAELGDSTTIDKGQPIFAAGFQGKSLKFYPGTVVAISHQSQDRGYGLAIGTAEILPGMSGGGLFSQTGTLIGINGKSIGTIDAASQQDRKNRVKPVSGLAIPINTFTQIASQLNVDLGNNQLVPVSSAITADDFFITAGNKSQKGDYQGAIADYDRVLAMNPNFEEVYFRRGIARSLLKNWQGAEADYTRAIEIEPGYSEAYLHRGNMRNILRNWRGAKADFDVAIGLRHNVGSAYVGRGIALCELNNCQSGIKDYDLAISIDRSSAEAYQHRGFAYHKLGDRQGAIANYITAADLYQQQGKDREYLETVQKIKQLVRG